MTHTRLQMLNEKEKYFLKDEPNSHLRDHRQPPSRLIPQMHPVPDAAKWGSHETRKKRPRTRQTTAENVKALMHAGNGVVRD